MGLLGRDAVRGLKQLPSAIYWQGLGTWGIRRFAGSRAQLHRDLTRVSRRGAVAEFSDPDEEPVRRGRLSAYWDPHLPTCPRDLTAVPDSLLTRVGLWSYRRRPGSEIAFRRSNLRWTVPRRTTVEVAEDRSDALR